MRLSFADLPRSQDSLSSIGEWTSAAPFELSVAEEYRMINRDSFVDSPEIQQLVTILTAKEEVSDDKRASVRESAVCPVTVQFQYELTRHRAFSRDISAGGICLIGERVVEVEQIATLCIYRIDDLSTKVRARCIWSKPFGDSYYLTGWKFLRRILQNNV